MYHKLDNNNSVISKLKYYNKLQSVCRPLGTIIADIKYVVHHWFNSITHLEVNSYLWYRKAFAYTTRGMGGQQNESNIWSPVQAHQTLVSRKYLKSLWRYLCLVSVLLLQAIIGAIFFYLTTRLPRFKLFCVTCCNPITT